MRREEIMGIFMVVDLMTFLVLGLLFASIVIPSAASPARARGY